MNPAIEATLSWRSSMAMSWNSKIFAALDAHHVVMVAPLIDLEHRAPTFEIVADHQTGSLELGQHAVDGGKPHFLARGQQNFVYILGGHVPDLGFLEDAQDFQARQGRLQTDLFKVGVAGRGCA